MNNDIVARLRVWSDWLNERCPDTEVRNDLRDAADEIERMRTVVEAWFKYSQRAERDIETLRAERDEARRSVCCQALPSDYKDWNPSAVNSALQSIAAQQGWNCFKEESK